MSGIMHSLWGGSFASGPFLYAWGNVGNGALGNNLAVGNKSSPTQIGALTAWSQVAAGNQGSGAIKTDGTMWLWGGNDTGQLGDDTNVVKSSPVQIGALTTWSKIDRGQTTAIALKTDGTMWTWGRNNNFGQLGDNTVINRSSPVQVGTLTTWTLIAAGQYFKVAIKTDGTMWSWGTNVDGQLGGNTVINRSSPVQIGALTTWSKIDVGAKHCLAIKTDGTLWTWGNNQLGQLGNNTDGTITNRSSPVQIGALTTWSKISGGRVFSLAIKTDGTLWAWGSNAACGELGDSTAYDKSSPIQIGALTTWSQIATGFSGDHSLALKTDGTMWSWGKNVDGQLGGNNVIYLSSPALVGTLTSWTQIAAGTAHSLAIG